MAGTSLFNGRILFDPTNYGDAKDPIDTVMMRDGVANGLCAAADGMAQVRAQFCGLEAGKAISKNYVSATGTPTANVWYRVCEVARFPIQIRASGDSYKLRFRIGGYTSNGSHAVKFQAVLAPPDINESVRFLARDYAAVTATTTSTTAVWLTATSRGTAASGTLLSISADDVASWVTTPGTLDDLGGNSVSVTQCVVSLVIYASTANSAGVPRLAAVHASEYVG